MRKLILAFLVVISVLCCNPYETQGSISNHDNFHTFNVVDEIVDVKFQEKEIFTLALNIYHEARGSTYEDKVAVAEVTMNRVRSERFPNTVQEVVYQYKQFSWTLSKRSREPKELEAWVECQKIALFVYSQKKPLIVDVNTLHYVHNTIVHKTKWARGFKNRKKIGAHIYLS